MIVTANRLARAGAQRPRQADLRRAVSTAYYALFHAIAKNAADMLVGTGKNRPDKAWTQLYRSLNHGEARSACEAARNLGFPASIVACADAFVQLQQERHAADYDPHHRIRRADALDAISLAESAIAKLRATPRRDLIALAVQLHFRKRRA